MSRANYIDLIASLRSEHFDLNSTPRSDYFDLNASPRSQGSPANEEGSIDGRLLHLDTGYYVLF